MVLFSSTQLTGDKCHFSQLGVNGVLMEREEPVYLRQGTQYRQAEVCGMCTQDRSGLEDSVWELTASRKFRSDHALEGSIGKIIPSDIKTSNLPQITWLIIEKAGS